MDLKINMLFYNIIRTTSTIYDNYIEMREGMAQRLLTATGEIKGCIGSPNFSLL